VGGFDMETKKVLMLDLDPQQEMSYKISFDTFYKGLSSNYSHVLRPFGYTNGGYVFIKLR
jgi:cellulose biosynthesis protein BcsQ